MCTDDKCDDNILILRCQSEGKYLDNVTWKSLGTLSYAYPKVERMAKFTMGLADKPVTDASSLRKTLPLRVPGLRPHFRGNRRFFVSGGFNSRDAWNGKQKVRWHCEVLCKYVSTKMRINLKILKEESGRHRSAIGCTTFGSASGYRLIDKALSLAKFVKCVK